MDFYLTGVDTKYFLYESLLLAQYLYAIKNCVKILFAYILLACFSSGFKKPAATKVTVAVAANMQYAFKALQQDYEKRSGAQIETIIGSSGKLTQQITEGAPFDIFISADIKYPQKLYQNHLTAGEPKIYANGVLVLWSAKPGVKPAANLQQLLDDKIKSIAIANPKTAPYGVAAEEILKSYGLLDKVKNKIVYGESITQTSQFIASQAADIGFTAKSIVLSDEMKGKGMWVDLDEKRYTPISQAAVILKYGQDNNAQASQKFYDYLYSAAAKNILKKFGYIVK